MREDYEKRLSEKVIGVFVDELNRRFSDNVYNVFILMSALFLQSERFLDVVLLKPFIDHYILRGVVWSVRGTLSNASPDCKNLLDVLRFIETYRKYYSQLHIAYQIGYTILSSVWCTLSHKSYCIRGITQIGICTHWCKTNKLRFLERFSAQVDRWYSRHACQRFLLK